MSNLLYESILLLKSICDGATNHDDKGFNKPDAYFINHITKLPFDKWTDSEKYETWTRLKKYKTQLLQFNIYFEEIPVPNKPKQEYIKRDINVINFKDNKFIISFTYNQIIVDYIKSSIPSIMREYDKDTKSWSIYINDHTIVIIKNMINKFGFIFDGDIEILKNIDISDIKSKKPVIITRPIDIIEEDNTITITEDDKENLLFHFKYDEKVKDICKLTLKGKWFPELKSWKINITTDNIDKIVDFLSLKRVKISNILAEKIINRKDEMKSLWTESHKDNVDVEIEGINTNLFPYQKAGVAYVLKSKRTFIADDMGCVDGDSIITVNIYKNSQKMTLTNFYNYFHNPKKQYPGESFYTKSLKDDAFGLNEVVDVLYQGNKDVYKLSLKDGKSINATFDHNILTQRGYVELKNINKNDLICVNEKRFPRYIEIESISFVGKKDVYDIKMKSPHHNFVANGIVVHNCGKSLQLLSSFVASKSKRLLVICTSSMKYVWEMEVKKWYPEKSVEVLKKGFDPNNLSDICIVNYDQIIQRKKNFKDFTIENLSDYIIEIGENILNNNKTLTNANIKKINDILEKMYGIKDAKSVYFEDPDGFKKLQEKYIKELNKIDDIYYDMAKDIKNIDYDFIGVDESHYLKNDKAERTKVALELSEKAKYRVLLTGTPIVNRPSELISQLKFLDRLEDLGGWWNFVHKYCDAKQVQYRNMKKPIWDITGCSNLEELNINLRKICYIRRTKEQVIKDLPEKIISYIPVDITNKKEYKEIENSFYSWYEENKDKNFDEEVNINQGEALIKLTYLRQSVAKGKIEAIVNWCNDFFEEDISRKLVVFTHHKETINSLMKAFKKYNPVKIVGGVSDKDKKDAIIKFQDDDNTKIIIGNLAMIEGVTLTRASHMVFSEFFFTYAQHDQAMSRIHRISQKFPCNYYYFKGINTIDDDMIEMIENKKNITEIVSNGFLKRKKKY